VRRAASRPTRANIVGRVHRARAADRHHVTDEHYLPSSAKTPSALPHPFAWIGRAAWGGTRGCFVQHSTARSTRRVSAACTLSTVSASLSGLAEPSTRFRVGHPVFPAVEQCSVGSVGVNPPRRTVLQYVTGEPSTRQRSVFDVIGGAPGYDQPTAPLFSASLYESKCAATPWLRSGRRSVDAVVETVDNVIAVVRVGIRGRLHDTRRIRIPSCTSSACRVARRHGEARGASASMSVASVGRARGQRPGPDEPCAFPWK